MKRIFTIFQKEMKDTIRDRKAMFFMVVFPLVIFPLLMGGATAISVKMIKKEQTKLLNVAIIGKEFPIQLLIDFENDTSLVLYKYYTQIEADSLILIDDFSIHLF